MNNQRSLSICCEAQVYAWMSHELLPRFFQTPSYQDLRLMHAIDQELDFFSPGTIRGWTTNPDPSRVKTIRDTST